MYLLFDCQPKYGISIGNAMVQESKDILPPLFRKCNLQLILFTVEIVSSQKIKQKIIE